MPMPSNEARHNLLSNERLDTFWDALWLELWPFLYFIVESRRIACRCLQTKRGAICYRMSVSKASGTPCGSSYGRFCLIWQQFLSKIFQYATKSTNYALMHFCLNSPPPRSMQMNKILDRALPAIAPPHVGKSAHCSSPPPRSRFLDF